MCADDGVLLCAHHRQSSLRAAEEGQLGGHAAHRSAAAVCHRNRHGVRSAREIHWNREVTSQCGFRVGLSCPIADNEVCSAFSYVLACGIHIVDACMRDSVCLPVGALQGDGAGGSDHSSGE